MCVCMRECLFVSVSLLTGDLFLGLVSLQGLVYVCVYGCVSLWVCLCVYVWVCVSVCYT